MTIPRIDIIDIDPRPGHDRARRRKRATLAAALTSAAALTAFTVTQAGAAAENAAPAAAAPAAAAARTVGAGVDSYAAVVDSVAPSVVTVRSVHRAERAAARMPFADDPLFRRFFGEDGIPEAQPRRQSGLGSGVIVRQDGYILTNHHVIDGAEEITVELSDRRKLTATVVGSDAPSDLAVLKVDAAGLPALTLGDSDQVRVGDVVLALGNPMGVGQTVTMGIISAKGRATGLGEGSFEDFLQTDAPINQGNSGGALVNTRGELVGINSQILSPSGGNIGIGFAIPANLARNVMQALIADGQVHRGMIGVTVQTVTADLARSLRLDEIEGALVSDVQEDGPADKAGVQRGDVVTAVNGEAVVDSNALRNRVAQMKPGTKATLDVLRDGRERQLSVVLDELPSAAAERDTPAAASADGAAGLSVQKLTPELARRMDIDAEAGVVITGVDPNSAAADAGFQRGDVIQEVDGKPVGDPNALREAIRGAGDRPALVLVQRGGASIYVPLAVA